MKCPKCGREMESGYVMAERRVYWVPDGKRPGMTIFSKSKVKIKGLAREYLPADICKVCQKVLVSYENREKDPYPDWYSSGH